MHRRHLDSIRAINSSFRSFRSVESLFELDMWSALPPEGGAYRQRTAAFIAQRKAELFFTDDARSAAEYFDGADVEGIDDYIERGLVRTFLARYRSAVRTPPELMREFNLIRADTMNAWKEAREKRDFRVFLPWLERVFYLKKRIALAIEPDAPAFDTLVGLVDAGARCADIDREFGVLAKGLRALLDRISASHVRPDTSFIDAEQDAERMETFARRMAVESGFSLSRGSFNNRVVHGFSSFMGPRDGRIATPRSGSFNMIFTYLHEAGHAMYASGGSDAVNEADMWGGCEGGLQEGMARFNENMVGRSREYWEHYYPQLQDEFDVLRGVSRDEFCRAVNAVRPSLRRIASDEVSYSLHVILRYEIERDYFSGAIEAADIEERWNDLSERYLGVRPQNAAEGVLQDMHWAGDYIGYFQSYALGNIYCGQILEAVQRDIPDMHAHIAKGSFEALNAWLDEHIRQYGCCFTAGEIAERISGKRLDAAPFLRYLDKKYGELYDLR